MKFVFRELQYLYLACRMSCNLQTFFRCPSFFTLQTLRILRFNSARCQCPGLIHVQSSQRLSVVMWRSVLSRLTGGSLREKALDDRREWRNVLSHLTAREGTWRSSGVFTLDCAIRHLAIVGSFHTGLRDKALGDRRESLNVCHI